MNITDLIQGAVASRTTRFAFELLPPLKGDGTRSVFGAIDPLMDFNPAYINVTFPVSYTHLRAHETSV